MDNELVPDTLLRLGIANNLFCSQTINKMGHQKRKNRTNKN